ncbi:hypothetical protein [Williamsia muralis]|jgi:hypothetical protein|uniref:Autophagy-related protein 2 n=1 Tax=Williamsia marianensis TaxID=85044 RepID=A0ABU4EYR4_WILMA|nr:MULTISPECIES: hypothetical protein [Williamsia]MDV7136390.1 hypothetical protein [Williamsia muralis]PVY33754.1 hypothetical protein C7458_101153 [Williamsia marianensis]
MSDSHPNEQPGSTNEPSKTVDDLEEKISQEHADSGKAGPSINDSDPGDSADSDSSGSDPSGDTSTAQGSATGEPPD